MKRQGVLLLLNNAPAILFGVVLAVFALLSEKFFVPANLVNVLVQSSSTAIVAIGMTFVLLTAGVDLSVGAIMFVAAAVAGKMLLGGSAMLPVVGVMLLIGLAFGVLNAVFITRFKVIAFIVTLATLYLGRGFALWLTETRSMNLPEAFVQWGTQRVGHIPLPVVVFLVFLVAAHLVLSRTAFGRQIYAVGNNLDAARKAGIPTGRILAAVYVISGFCAAVGGLVALTQLGSVNSTFGERKEFAAIAAAVLGGTSLFGGRGRVFPGTVLGAVLIQTVENGLVILDADPYLYPILTSAIIFLAVLMDSARTRLLERLGRRQIRVEKDD